MIPTLLCIMQLAFIKMRATALLVYTLILVLGVSSRSLSMDHHKPAIVFIPGAWLTPGQYTQLLDVLDSSGYRTFIQGLPSVNSQNPEAQTVTTDAAFVREHLILPQIREKREVVLVMHSYGGIPGPVAANGLSKQELSAQGKPGGIVGMIMLSAFIALEGQSVRDKIINRQYSSWVLQFVRRHLLSEEMP